MSASVAERLRRAVVPAVVPALSLLAVLGGCAAERAETLATDSAPSASAAVSRSAFRSALTCLDLQLARRLPRTTDVVVGIMPDNSLKLPIGLRDMTMNAIGKATVRSGAFRVIDIDPTGSHLVLSGLDGLPLPAGPTPHLEPTSLHLTGSIVSVTRSAYVESADIGGGAPEGRLGISHVAQLGAVTTGMRLSRFGTREQLYNEQHQMVLRDRQTGADIVAEIGGFAVGGGLSFERRESPALAVQALVDLHVVELLGKAAGVPYWECLGDRATDPAWASARAGEWREMDATTRQQRLEAGLQALGYADPFATALARFQVDNGLLATGRPGFETWLAMAGALPGGVPEATAQQTHAGVAPNGLSLAISRIRPTVRLEIGLLRTAHVRCFSRDGEDGSISQILPSPFQPDGRLAASTRHFVPNTIAEKSISIRGQGLGFLCVATPESLDGRLPEAYRAAPFSDLRRRGVDSVGRLLGDIERASGGTAVVATAGAI